VYSYALTLDVDRETVRYVARLLSAERRRRGTRRGTRLLTPFKQALFGLAWLRDRVDVERLGAGFGLSRTTSYRYRDEVLEVVSDQALRRTDSGLNRTDGLPLHVNARTYNKLLRGLRCLGERGFAVLTERWKALEHVTISPRRITQIARAALAVTRFERRIAS